MENGIETEDFKKTWRRRKTICRLGKLLRINMTREGGRGGRKNLIKNKSFAYAPMIS